MVSCALQVMGPWEPLAQAGALLLTDAGGRGHHLAEGAPGGDRLVAVPGPEMGLFLPVPGWGAGREGGSPFSPLNQFLLLSWGISPNVY